MVREKMSAKIRFVIGVIILVGCFAATITAAAERTSLPLIKDTSVSIPIDEFGRFIKDGRISLPWSEFEKFVVSESGSRYIRIPWELLLKYLDPITAVQAPKPPVDYILSSFVYTGKSDKDNLTLKFSANLVILKNPADGWTTVKLWPTNAGFLSSLSLNEKPTRVLTSDNIYQVLINETGTYRLEGELRLKTYGNVVRFPVPAGTGSRVNLTLPKDYNAVVQGATTLDLNRTADATEAEATFTPNSQVDIAWMPVVKEPDEAKILAGAAISYTVQPEVVRTTASLRYEILYKPVRFLKVAVPQGVRINTVSGDLIDWKEENGAIQVELRPETKGLVNLSVSYEQDLKPDAAEIELTSPSVMDAEKTAGYATIATAPNIEVSTVPVEGLTVVDPREVPGTGQSAALAFRFNRMPFSAKLSLVRHKELSVLEATSDSANAITAVTLDGKTITRVIFHIRNNAKQFLRVILPKDAQLWSVYVADAPTKPLAGQPGEILIPLLKTGSRPENALPVEVIYYLAGKPFEKGGDFQIALPTIDVPVMHFMYSLYLPEKIRLEDFSGNLEKVADFTFPEESLLENGMVSGGERVNAEKAKTGERTPARETQGQGFQYKTQQSLLEMNVSSADALSRPSVSSSLSAVYGSTSNKPSEPVSGLLPLRIYIPATGQLLRFEKRLVIQEQLTVKARYRLSIKNSFWGER